jgi:hypothetical protein
MWAPFWAHTYSYGELKSRFSLVENYGLGQVLLFVLGMSFGRSRKGLRCRAKLSPILEGSQEEELLSFWISGGPREEGGVSKSA